MSKMCSHLLPGTCNSQLGRGHGLASIGAVEIGVGAKTLVNLVEIGSIKVETGVSLKESSQIDRGHRKSLRVYSWHSDEKETTNYTILWFGISEIFTGAPRLWCIVKREVGMDSKLYGQSGFSKNSYNRGNLKFINANTKSKPWGWQNIKENNKSLNGQRKNQDWKIMEWIKYRESALWNIKYSISDLRR